MKIDIYPLIHSLIIGNFLLKGYHVHLDNDIIKKSVEYFKVSYFFKKNVSSIIDIVLLK